MKDPVIVGLPDTAVKESLERIHSALENCGYEAPNRRITMNLGPADLRKEGPAFDLPIALGVIFANGLGTTDRAGEYLVAGELALDGRVRLIRGALSMSLLARERKFAGLLVPRENAEEATVVEDVDVIPVTSLSEAAGFLQSNCRSNRPASISIRCSRSHRRTTWISPLFAVRRRSSVPPRSRPPGGTTSWL